MRANLYIVATSCNQSSVAVLLTCNSVAQCYTYCNPQSFAFVEFFTNRSSLEILQNFGLPLQWFILVKVEHQNAQCLHVNAMFKQCALCDT